MDNTLKKIIRERINEMPIKANYILVREIKAYCDLVDSYGCLDGISIFISPSMISEYLIMT